MKSTHRQLCTYLECVKLLNNLRFFEIYFFGNQEHFSVYFSHVFQKIYYSPTFQLQFVQVVVWFYNLWNLQSSTSVTSLKTYITNIDAGIPSVSYLVYRGSLQISCVIRGRIKFKRGFYLQNIPKEFFFMEWHNSVPLSTLRVLVLLWYTSNS
jgi:hypothetical protein